MKIINKKSTYLLKSTKTNSFGTAFCIDQTKEGSFFLTASHVIHDCQEDALEIGGKKAKLIVSGEAKEIDLAVVFVKGLKATPLRLNKSLLFEGMPVKIEGFKAHLQHHKREILEGMVKKISKLRTKYRDLDLYELTLEAEDSIERGYSGSAVVVNGYVFAVVVSRYNQMHADAIPLRYLEEIWEEMPKGLLEESSVEKISGVLEPQPLLAVKKRVKKRYFLYLFLMLSVLFFLWRLPYAKEANRLSHFDTQMAQLYSRWEGIAKYKKSEQQRARIADEAVVLAEEMVNIDEEYLDSLQNRTERYERISYAYGVASHMSSSRKKRIEFARKSIDAGEKALSLMNGLGEDSQRKNRIELMVTLAYIIRVEAGEESLFNEAKRKYMDIAEYYNNPAKITNHIDVIDRFIERLVK